MLLYIQYNIKMLKFCLCFYLFLKYSAQFGFSADTINYVALIEKSIAKYLFLRNVFSYASFFTSVTFKFINYLLYVHYFITEIYNFGAIFFLT